MIEWKQNWVLGCAHYFCLQRQPSDSGVTSIFDRVPNKFSAYFLLISSSLCTLCAHQPAAAATACRNAHQYSCCGISGRQWRAHIRSPLHKGWGRTRKQTEYRCKADPVRSLLSAASWLLKRENDPSIIPSSPAPPLICLRTERVRERETALMFPFFFFLIFCHFSPWLLLLSLSRSCTFSLLFCLLLPL